MALSLKTNTACLRSYRLHAQLLGISHAHRKMLPGLSGRVLPAVPLLPCRRRDAEASIQALRQHCVGDFDKPGDIRAVHVVDAAIGAHAVLHAVGVDFFHDHVQAFIDVGMTP